MRKRCFFVLLMVTFLLLLSCPLVFAETTMECNATIEGETICISGRLSGVEGGQQIFLLVGDWDNVLYVNQTQSDENGSFSFSFLLPDETPSGQYEFRLGTPALTTPYTGILTYGEYENLNFMSADLDINVSAYVPQLTGTVSCAAGKSIDILIENKTDQTVIFQQTVTSANGEFPISCTLPNLLSGKDCDVFIRCMEGTTVKAQIDATISSQLLTISLDGTAQTADNVNMSAILTDTNTGIVDRQITFSGNRAVNATLPNVLPYMAFHLVIEGNEQEFNTSADNAVTTFELTGNANAKKTISLTGKNISNLNGKTFTLQYDATKLSVIDLIAQEYEVITQTGAYRDITIVALNEGQITFRVNKRSAGAGTVWNGLLNMFRFQFAPNFSGTTTVTVEMQ